MPLTFSIIQYADMVYVYGFCNTNAVHAVAEYQPHFETVGYQPKKYLCECTRHCEILLHLLGFALHLSMMLIKASLKKKTLYRWYNVLVNKEMQYVLLLSK
jgi:hypothetical protein